MTGVVDLAKIITKIFNALPPPHKISSGNDITPRPNTPDMFVKPHFIMFLPHPHIWYENWDNPFPQFQSEQ